MENESKWIFGIGGILMVALIVWAVSNHIKKNDPNYNPNKEYAIKKIEENPSVRKKLEQITKVLSKEQNYPDSVQAGDYFSSELKIINNPNDSAYLYEDETFIVSIESFKQGKCPVFLNWSHNIISSILTNDPSFEYPRNETKERFDKDLKDFLNVKYLLVIDQMLYKKPQINIKDTNFYPGSVMKRTNLYDLSNIKLSQKVDSNVFYAESSPSVKVKNKNFEEGKIYLEQERLESDVFKNINRIVWKYYFIDFYKRYKR